jgi:predicted MFS family arabinose efflux permease
MAQPARAPTPRVQLVLLIASLCLVVGVNQAVLTPFLPAVASAVGAPIDVVTKATVAAYFLVAGPVGAILGATADWLPRKSLLSAALCLAVVALSSTALSTSLSALVLSRALSGLAAGAALPVVYSCIGDLVAVVDRPKFAATAGMASGIGAAIGQLCGGVVPVQHWRAVAGGLACVVAALALAFVTAFREPAREVSRDVSEGSPSAAILLSAGRFSRVLRIPSVRILVLQGLAGSLAWTCVTVFLPSHLSALGLQPAAVSVVSLSFGLGGLAGGWVGGRVGSRLAGSPRRLALAVGGMQALAGVPMAALLLRGASNAGDAPTLALAAAGGLVASVAGPCLRAMLLGATPSDARASSFAAGALIDALSKAVAPALVAEALARGATADHVQSRAAVLSAVMLVGWGASGAAIAFASRSLEADSSAAAAKRE